MQAVILSAGLGMYFSASAILYQWLRKCIHIWSLEKAMFVPRTSASIKLVNGKAMKRCSQVFPVDAPRLQELIRDIRDDANLYAAMLQEDVVRIMTLLYHFRKEFFVDTMDHIVLFKRSVEVFAVKTLSYKGQTSYDRSLLIDMVEYKQWVIAYHLCALFLYCSFTYILITTAM